jgi:hypothetical protein
MISNKISFIMTIMTIIGVKEELIDFFPLNFTFAFCLKYNFSIFPHYQIRIPPENFFIFLTDGKE